MSLKHEGFHTEAILFLKDDEVVKEMLHVEFEAVLDGIVGIPECRSETYHGAYVSIAGGLTLYAAVLFTIEFDDDGHVVPSWNLPLKYLASQAPAGPDLGCGPIRVMTASHCQDARYQADLWHCEQQLEKVLGAIKKSLTANKMSLFEGNAGSGFSGSPGSATAAGFGGPGFGGSGFGNSGFGSAGLTNSGPMSMTNQNYLAANLEIALRHQHQQVMAELQNSHADAMQQMAEKNAELEEKCALLTSRIERRELESRKLIDAVVDKYRAKFSAELVEQESAWQARLAEKDRQLQAGQAREHELREEMQLLKANIEDDRSQDRDELICNLLANGIELIVSQSGVGSYALKADQVQAYVGNKTAYWAARCGVPEAHFSAWQAHYQRPVCQAGASIGRECASALQRVVSPKAFVIGDSDMCHTHRLKQLAELY